MPTRLNDRMNEIFRARGVSEADIAWGNANMPKYVSTFEPQAGPTNVAQAISQGIDHKIVEKLRSLPRALAWLGGFPQIPEVGVSDEDCAICLEPLHEASTSAVTAEVQGFECGHIFHSECTQEATTLGHNCPMCRTHFDRIFVFDFDVALNKIKRDSFSCFFVRQAGWPGARAMVSCAFEMRYDTIMNEDGTESQRLNYVELISFHPCSWGRDHSADEDEDEDEDDNEINDQAIELGWEVDEDEEEEFLLALVPQMDDDPHINLMLRRLVIERAFRGTGV